MGFISVAGVNRRKQPPLVVVRGIINGGCNYSARQRGPPIKAARINGEGPSLINADTAVGVVSWSALSAKRRCNEQPSDAVAHVDLSYLSSSLSSFRACFTEEGCCELSYKKVARRRRGAATMRKYETSRIGRIPSSSPSWPMQRALHSHRCNLHRPATHTTIEAHWGKMGANQSTRSAPTPGEEGKEGPFDSARTARSIFRDPRPIERRSSASKRGSSWKYIADRSPASA